MQDSTVHELCAAADSIFNEFYGGCLADHPREVNQFLQLSEMIPTRHYSSAYYGTFSQMGDKPLMPLSDKVLMIKVISTCLKAGMLLQKMKTSGYNQQQYTDFSGLITTIEVTFNMVRSIVPNQTKWVQDRIQEFKAELINK